MTLDVVNSDNEKVGSIDLSDAVFAGRPKLDLVWESVVRANASERRGTHMTKNRALVSGSGHKISCEVRMVSKPASTSRALMSSRVSQFCYRFDVSRFNVRATPSGACHSLL